MLIKTGESKWSPYRYEDKVTSLYNSMKHLRCVFDNAPNIKTKRIAYNAFKQCLEKYETRLLDHANSHNWSKIPDNSVNVVKRYRDQLKLMSYELDYLKQTGSIPLTY